MVCQSCVWWLPRLARGARTLPGIVQLCVRVKALCRTGVQLEHVSDLGAGTLSQVPVMDAHGRAASVRYLSGHAWLVS